METIAENVITQFGAVGLLVVILIYYTNKLFRKIEDRECAHALEREQFKTELFKHSDLWREEIGKQNQYIVMHFDRTMSVLAEIRTIINQRKDQ